MAKITSQLLELAELSGVGGNRTAGFGWVEVRYPKKGSNESRKTDNRPSPDA
jgi:CRISPR/Cas system CSM-associated protein Csm3 (group 7 of RAMP superfamily)